MSQLGNGLKGFWEATKKIVAKQRDKCKWGVQEKSPRCQGGGKDQSRSQNSQTGLGSSF